MTRDAGAGFLPGALLSARLLPGRREIFLALHPAVLNAFIERFSVACIRERILECASHAILLANVLFITATFPNPPALRAAPFTKGGFWVPSFIKGGTGRISPAVSPCLRLCSPKPCFGSVTGEAWLRLPKAGARLPHFEPNPNTGHALGQDDILERADQEVFHDARHPSHLTLPVIPRS